MAVRCNLNPSGELTQPWCELSPCSDRTGWVAHTNASGPSSLIPFYTLSSGVSQGIMETGSASPTCLGREIRL